MAVNVATTTTTKEGNELIYDGKSTVNRKEFPNRRELVELVQKSGIVSHSSTMVKSPLLLSKSEPSSPLKLYRSRKNPFITENDDSSCSTGSSTTITSEDGCELREFNNDPSTKYPSSEDHPITTSIPSLVISHEADETDIFCEFRPRTGSTFYHESFTSGQQSSSANTKPSMYLPMSRSAQQFTFNKPPKKQNGLFNRLRHSFNKHKPIVTDKKQRKWIDHEDDLDPVSRPSYFRHIGHVIKAGPGCVHTIQLNRPPQGKFGVYIAEGRDSETDSKSIFVTRFYQENMSMFYSSLLKPGDEIVAINDCLVRDVTILHVIKLLSDLQSVQLTILPVNTTHNDVIDRH